jgi:hypothetical protein
MGVMDQDRDDERLRALAAGLVSAEIAFVAEVREQLGRRWPRRTLKDVSRAIGIPISTLQRWETDDRVYRWHGRLHTRRRPSSVPVDGNLAIADFSSTS